MSDIYVFSGPCGCGKSTLSEAFARHLVNTGVKPQIYVVHGDHFHQGFIETNRHFDPSGVSFLPWPAVLQFNWECILNVAQKVLDRNLDVLIDYIVEDELPLLKELARRNNARLYYVVLTATEDELTQRLTQRGSSALIDRALFLRIKLLNTPGNQGHLYNISGKTIEQEIADLNISQYEVLLS